MRIQFLPAPGASGPKWTSIEPSALTCGLSMAFSDGNGCPLSRPEAVIESYTVTDQNNAAGMPLGRFSV
ncbi:hypothetical protein D3C72_2386810 [compost metagenome]